MYLGKERVKKMFLKEIIFEMWRDRGEEGLLIRNEMWPSNCTVREK